MKIFSRIDNRIDAIKVIRSASTLLAFFIAIKLFFIGNRFVDTIIDTIFLCLLWRFNSRLAALFFLIVWPATYIFTKGEMLFHPGEEANFFLILLIAFASVRATEASFKLHGRFKETQ